MLLAVVRVQWIAEAQSSVRILTPYFLPDSALSTALDLAAFLLVVGVLYYGYTGESRQIGMRLSLFVWSGGERFPTLDSGLLTLD